MTREEAIKELQLIAKITMWNDRREAVDMAIEALSAEVVHKPDYSYEADMVRRIIKEALLAKAGRPKVEWIPVTERLPNDEGCYLVCMSWEHDRMDVLTWADGWNCYRGYDGKISKENEIDGADIIAWMPLPKPYKGGDDE